MIKISVGTLIPVACSIMIVAADSAHPVPGTAAKVARGKYLVEQVGLCGDCHTPRDDRGRPIVAKHLQGALIDFKPVAPVPVWADKAPNIAGLPGWEDAAVMKFLITGIDYNGLPPRPPMPEYRFNRQDAEAVLAYLRSLAPAAAKQGK